MKLRLQLTPSHREDLRKITKIGADRLAAASVHVREVHMLRPGELRKALQKSLREEEARPLVRQLLAIASVKREKAVDIHEIGKAVTESLRGMQKNDFVDDWEKVRPAFEEMLAATSVVVTSKALSLSYDYANWLDGCRILTDIRPVYDDPHEKIVGAIVTHVFRLEYSSDEGRHSLSVALNDEDVLKVLKACNEAIKKAKVAKELATEKLGVKTFIAGEENYDSD